MTETLPMTQQTRLLETAPAQPRQRRGVERVLLDSAYALTAFPIGIASFVAAVVLLATGLGLSIIVGGFLLIVLGVYVARGFAVLERTRLRGMLTKHAPHPRYLGSEPGAGFWRRTLMPLKDPQSWLDVLWSLLQLATGTFGFVLVVTWWSVAGGGITYWFWSRFLPDGGDDENLAQLIGLGDSRAADVGLMTIIGIVALLTLPLAVRLAAVVGSSTSSVLLCSRAELQSRVTQVEDSRAAARTAEAESLRRLERDIHDGPQQRLVRLQMDLGRARRHLDSEPERSGAILDDALRQARETVDELRSLSRGIAPPLLVDRGLAAAVEEVAAGCPVPTEVSVDVPADLPPHVETTAYFVVAEALTNVAKHSGAHAARVSVGFADGLLEVLVLDDGIGGAHPGKGVGLAGLAGRVAGAEGELDVSSPEGGPTVVRARIPVGER